MLIGPHQNHRAYIGFKAPWQPAKRHSTQNKKHGAQQDGDSRLMTLDAERRCAICRYAECRGARFKGLLRFAHKPEQ